MPDHLKLAVSAPPTMSLTIEVDPDYLRFENGRLIHRPPHMSRDRWLRFWKELAARGLSPETFDATARFVGLPPFPRKPKRSSP
jgi:hypothetical protein